MACSEAPEQLPVQLPQNQYISQLTQLNMTHHNNEKIDIANKLFVTKFEITNGEGAPRSGE